uniref:Uncharacterized protein n=1 Tax=Tanacetum cinerariifolium TaxID=118510 RepID=A0A699HWE5_TANCI|nr:hypothetical protein [Tanacetum cinerariifolium]
MYTSICSDIDLPSSGIPLLDAYEFEPEAPLSPVQALEDPEYLAPSDNDIAPVENQTLPTSPIALSSSYIVDSEPIKDDFEEYPEMDPMDYANEEEEEEPSDDEEDEEEEEYLASADSKLFVSDSVSSAKETEPFETDESAATPPPLRSPHTVIPLSQTGLHRARKTVRPYPPMAASTEAFIIEYAPAPTPPSLLSHHAKAESQGIITTQGLKIKKTKKDIH